MKPGIVTELIACGYLISQVQDGWLVVLMAIGVDIAVYAMTNPTAFRGIDSKSENYRG